MSNKNRNNKSITRTLMVGATCLALAGLVGILAFSGTALAKKPAGKGGGQTALHGCITFRDAVDDRVRSDGRDLDGDGFSDPYCDGFDNTTGGLGGFFRFITKVKNNGTGRPLFLDFTDFVPEPGFDLIADCLPANENISVLNLPRTSGEGTLADWRDQGVGIPISVKRRGKILFGRTGKDEAKVSFGFFGLGDLLTVTRIDIDGDGVFEDVIDDVWTIQSFALDTAVLWRDRDADGIPIVCGSGSMPFLVTYDGRPAP